MRHRKKLNHLGRKANHRKAMLANMANSLILNKRISTTTAKAKALRIFVEPLITKSKEDSTHSRRQVFSYLQNKEAVSELFREVSPKITDRPGGYTRILKTGARLGDNADMCIIELVDYNKNLLAAKDEAKEKSGRRRRRGSKKSTTTSTEAAAVTGEEKEQIADAKVEGSSEVETVETVEGEVKAEEKEVEKEKKEDESVKSEDDTEEAEEPKA